MMEDLQARHRDRLAFLWTNGLPISRTRRRDCEIGVSARDGLGHVPRIAMLMQLVRSNMVDVNQNGS